MVKKKVGLQMVWILNENWNPEAQPFEICKNGHHFVKSHLKCRQKCLDFEWSSFWMVGTIAIAKAPFENWTIWNSTFKKSRFPMVRFQIPTVQWGYEIINRDLPSFNTYNYLFYLSVLQQVQILTDHRFNIHFDIRFEVEYLDLEPSHILFANYST